ncbi:MAG: 50S ribosomal protein L9 [Gammaproteobacteria bacterium]
MEVVLLEKIQNLGDLGDTVKVKPGFGRNFLIPQKKAVPATPENVEKFEAQRAELEKAQADSLKAAQARAEALKDFQVQISAKVGSEGKLYGSIGTAEIAAAVTAAGEELEKREVRLPEGAIREVGQHAVGLHFHADVDIEITVDVIAEDETEGA